MLKYKKSLTPFGELECILKSTTKQNWIVGRMGPQTKSEPLEAMCTHPIPVRYERRVRDQLFHLINGLAPYSGIK